MATMHRINRRHWIRLATLAIGTSLTQIRSSTATAETDKTRSALGVVMYDCGIRRTWLKNQNTVFDLYHPFNFLDHCRSIGAGGAQVALKTMNDRDAGRFRETAAEYGMFIDGILSPPKNEKDLSRFEAEIQTAAKVGVQAVRTVIIPGRRYERYESFEAFQEFERRGVRMVELATPIVEKYRVPLAIENHKDQRLEDRVALLEHIDSEFLGACIDTGNSIALLDDAYGTVEALAPYAFSVHFKDQALSEYENGFLLADVPLGRGSLDLPRMTDIIRKQKPNVKFSLEVITRDPLKVPCLTDAYWKTVSDAGGADLARTLRLVRDHRKSGQEVSKLSLEAQVALEDQNVRSSLKHARDQLGFKFS